MRNVGWWNKRNMDLEQQPKHENQYKTRTRSHPIPRNSLRTKRRLEISINKARRNTKDMPRQDKATRLARGTINIPNKRNYPSKTDIPPKHNKHYYNKKCPTNHQENGQTTGRLYKILPRLPHLSKPQVLILPKTDGARTEQHRRPNKY